MKTLNTLFFIISILATTLLLIPSHGYADSCAPTEIPLTTAQHILLASNVFVGTVTSIKNDTDHQWNVHFSIEKLWKGTAGQSLSVTTHELQGCRYSITTGVKYLVYTSGFPPWLQMSWTRPYADSQNDIAMLNDHNFQAQEKTKEELNKKLEVAKDSISNMMGSKMSPIPINMVSVDVLNSTLDVGIDSAKAKLSEEKYQEKLREIVGNIPIKISFGQYFALPARVADNSTRNDSLSIMSPLEQSKSGIKTENIVCKGGLQLVIKSEDGSPACVTSTTAQKLCERGWQLCISFHYTKTASFNPLDVTALVTYTPPNSCLGLSCPPYTFYLKINSNSTAYLLGYDICGSDLCVKNSTLSVLLPINNMQI